jgi:GxxExxY protein
MSIRVFSDLRSLSQDEFGAIAYRVMEHAFAVHHDMGRFFDEVIYRNAVFQRLGCFAEKEVCVEVLFEDFCKQYRIDLIVDRGAIFELKAVTELGNLHRAQLLNYLLLCDLAHGKLINFRPGKVEHEFVNTSLTRSDRIRFRIATHKWVDSSSSARQFPQWLEAFLRTVGAGLDLRLYEEAASHFFGGDVAVTHKVSIKNLGNQKMRLAEPGWALKVTALKPRDLAAFEDHALRLVSQTDLSGIHWVNVTLESVCFKSILRDR